MSNRLFYDQECPFCENYVKMAEIKSAIPNIELVNLRGDREKAEAFSARGMSPDKGMILELNGVFYFADKALQKINELSKSKNRVFRLTQGLFSSVMLSFIFYPILRSGRWLALFLLGKELIECDQQVRAKEAIFAWAFSVFSVVHFLFYMLDLKRFPPDADLIVLFFTALLVFIKPTSRRLLFLLMLASTVSTYIQAPVTSNHTMVRTSLLLAYWLSFAWALAKAIDFSNVFKGFAVGGQGALIVMYFFGIFHKINTDFLDPETSCSMALWEKMPWPLNEINGGLMGQSAVYGTFIIEGLVALMLFSSRTRHIGIVVGIGFHMLLALSGYTLFLGFSMLAVCMHLLWLSDEGAARIVNTNWVKKLESKSIRVGGYIATLMLLFGMFLSGILGNYSIGTMLALPLIVPFCLIVIAYGGSQSNIWSGTPKTFIFLGLLTATLFFANNSLPYTGLKTGQAGNMYANLSLEGGKSNHLIFKDPPSLFNHLENVAIITKASEGSALKPFEKSDFGIVFYELLGKLEDNPELTVSFTMNGKNFNNVSREDFKEEIKETLHHKIIRKWLHFQPVYLKERESCNI